MPEQRRRREAAFSLIELLVALAILALVLTTSLAIFFDRQKRLILAAENIEAYQALGNEAEFQKHRSWGELQPGGPRQFETLHPIDPNEKTIVDSLTNVSDKVVIADAAPGVRSVTMTLTWGNAKAPHQAALTILKTQVQIW